MSSRTPIYTVDRRRILRLVWAFVCLALAAVLVTHAAFGLMPPAEGAAVAIIANPGVPVDELSLAQLRKIFLGERQFWNSSSRIVLLAPSSVAREREVVLRSIYQMTESQYNQYWIAMVMRAEVTSAPKSAASAEQANELIAGTSGSIGFVPAGKVQPGVKVLRINGKLPGQSGYPLK